MQKINSQKGLSMKLTGLILTGGGARGAYQAGALRAIGEIANELQISQPFPILSGSSAGAINASFLASNAENMHTATLKLVEMWSNLHTGNIYDAGTYTLARLGLRWLTDLISGNLYKDKKARALLDTSPLASLIKQNFDPDKVEANIADGHLHSIGLSAVNYTTGNKEIFFQTDHDVSPWARLDRFAIKTNLNVKHILASSAIPLLFPPVFINGCYYGDGSLRNYTPLSPAIRMGAEKLLIIAVKKKSMLAPTPQHNGDYTKPSLGRTVSLVLNAVLLDAIELDYERAARINTTVQFLRPDAPTALRPLEMLMLRPSADIGNIAAQHEKSFPKTVRHLIRGLGSTNEASDLISYLLFEPPYINTLLELGYQDTMAQKAAVVDFYSK
jgi:NTE family protein